MERRFLRNLGWKGDSEGQGSAVINCPICAANVIEHGLHLHHVQPLSPLTISLRLFRARPD
jgi:hypothetical protein